MWISCWNCGEDVWLETQKQCRHCDAPTHRCADCEHYDADGPRCLALNIEMNPDDAERPTRLALSFNCAEFRMTEVAAQRHGAVRAEQAGTASHPLPAPHREGEWHTATAGRQDAGAPTAAAGRQDAGTPTATATAGRQDAGAPTAAATAGRQDAGAPRDGEEVITIRREPPLKHPQLPIAIAHRGDSGAAPENTLTAFKGAVAAGAHGVELDVHITRDGQPVVIHDATVDRTTNGKGAVAALTLEEIKALDAGSWFAEPFEGEQVPTLDEVFEALPAPTVLFVHLRAHENESDRCERAVVEATARHDTRKRTCVTHHTRHGLARLRELDPGLRLCWIPYGGEMGDEYIDDAYLLGTRFIQPRAAGINERFMAYARTKGMWVNAFWADEIEEMERLIRLDVDGIITNYPRRLREVLRGFG